MLAHIFNNSIDIYKQSAIQLKNDIDVIVNGNGGNQKWIDEFKTHRNITELTRNVVVSLIKRISVTECGIIDITFMYSDKFQTMAQILLQLQPKAAKFVRKETVFNKEK